MSLDSEILTALRHLLTGHGVQARWNGIGLLVLVSPVRRDQQIDLGGFVDTPVRSQPELGYGCGLDRACPGQ